MKFTKKMADVMPQRDMVYLLHEHLSGRDKHRGLKKVHASELTRADGFCPRLYALADTTKAKLPDAWLTTSETVTFALGRWLQDQVVIWFAEMGKAIAHWRCLACRHLHEFQKRPLTCTTCGNRSFWPEEVRFTSAATGVSCGVDMLLSLGEPKLTPVEIKSIKAEKFKELVGPLAEHRLRTNLYLRILGESEEPWASVVSSEKSHVLYVSKGGYGNADPKLRTWGLYENFSPFKRYDVKRDDKQTEALVQRALVIKAFREKAIGMPGGICPSSLSHRAKKCPLAKHCFSGEHPPTHDWQAATGGAAE